jgi:plasmid stabilization system protein ParE
MAYTIIWLPTANETMYELTNFLAENWSGKVVAKFVDTVYEAVDRLQNFPDMGLLIDEDRSIRSLIIRPYTKIFYQVANQHIFILRLVDTRRNPET